MSKPKLSTAPVFRIERGVVLIPPARSLYPFAKMELGDSFLITDEKQFKKARAAAYASAKAQRREFTCRTVENGLRIWRTK